MALLSWEQISDNLPELGEHLTGSLYLSGSLDVTGSIIINGVDIEALITGSGIFQPTGSFYATTNDLEITGSLEIELIQLDDTFTISTGLTEHLEVNQQGRVKVGALSVEPTAVPGGIYFSTDNNFYFGFDN